MFNRQQNLFSLFQQFRKDFVGDPRQAVELMLKNGKVTQEQIDNATRIAEQLKNLM